MNQVIVCEQCNESFPAWPYEVANGRKFCSPRCQNLSRRNTPEKFWQHVTKTDGCWIWNGSVTNDGYGKFAYDGEQLAHRVAYKFMHGSIPDGLQLDHKCRCRNCVNPAHLEPVTQRENIMRGDGVAAKESKATHCINGHPFTDENTYLRKDGGRYCRECGRIRYKAYKKRKRSAA